MTVRMFEHAGPEKVKLLFDAKRPEMADHPGTCRVEIHEIQQHCGNVVPAKFVPIEGEGEQHVNAGSRQDPIGAAYIKLAQTDGGCLMILAEQNGRDEVAGDHEKNLHAGEGVIRKERRHHFDVGEVGNTHEGDRNGAQTVERRDTLHTSSLAFSVVQGAAI